MLSGNKIVELDGLSSFSGLKVANLARNEITDLSTLQKSAGSIENLDVVSRMNPH